MRRRSIVLAAMVAAAVSAAPLRAEMNEAQREACAEAELRYQEQFGRPSAQEPTPVVVMYKHTFCPTTLTVKAGTKVRFVNVERRVSHSFWFKDAGREESDRFFPGEGGDMVMDLPPGEHTYLCGPHWERDGMIGKVIVTP